MKFLILFSEKFLEWVQYLLKDHLLHKNKCYLFIILNIDKFSGVVNLTFFRGYSLNTSPTL